MPSVSSFSLNDQPVNGKVRELKPGERTALLNDGQDQLLVSAGGKDYVIEGESLTLDALKTGLSGGKVPKAQLSLDGVKQTAKVQHVNDEATGLIEQLRQGFSVPAGWGKPSQIAATLDELADLKGNRDGLWHNEKEAKGSIGGPLARNPLALKARQHVVGKDVSRPMTDALSRFRLEQEAKWGQSVTSLDISQLKDGELFAAQKALDLTRMDRTPAEVTEGFVKAAGKVNGQAIAPRDVFWQRFKPVGEPSGKLVVMFPGFLQTSRNFHEQVALLNKQGHDVMVMDQQWAGQTKGGKAGGVDRGFGITRDVAAVAAYAQTQLDADYGAHPGKELVLMGTSLGGGPGVIGALTMNENKLLELEGPPMPQNVKVVLQGPFLGDTPSFQNKAVNSGSRIPLIKELPLPASGLPVLTSDPTAAQKIAQGAVLDDIQARLQVMGAVNSDVDQIKALISAGKGPKVPIEILHSAGDPLADPEQSRWLAQQLPQASLKLLPHNNHVLEQQQADQIEALTALERLSSPAAQISETGWAKGQAAPPKTDKSKSRDGV